MKADRLRIVTIGDRHIYLDHIAYWEKMAPFGIGSEQLIITFIGGATMYFCGSEMEEMLEILESEQKAP